MKHDILIWLTGVISGIGLGIIIAALTIRGSVFHRKAGD
jgi:hypothetical protein